MTDTLSLVHRLWRIPVWLAFAVVPLLAAPVDQATGRTPTSYVYAGVGEELTTFRLDVESGTLEKQSAVVLPGFVQEAWAPLSKPFLYVAWSNGGASYAGSGVTPAGDRHGVTAFRIDVASGALEAIGAPALLRSRAIHITGDGPGRHLLVAYNDPSGISVHRIGNDGAVGAEVPQPSTLDVGIYAHQVRVTPGNKSVLLVTRGNQPTPSTREDPGAVKVFRYEDGRLTNLASIAPAKGLAFRSRHLDFHPTQPWAFLTIESQNRLEMFTLTDDGSLRASATFSVSTLPAGNEAARGQTTSTVHVHPNGRFVYVGNRASGTTDVNGTAVWAGGSNDIAVFAIDQTTGAPTLIQNMDSRGITPRTFALDFSGRVLVVGNQTTAEARNGAKPTRVPANLAVFGIRSDGRLEFVRRYDVAVGRKPLWWMGLVSLQ